MNPILLPSGLWHFYTQFYLLWRKNAGMGLPTSPCEDNGIPRNISVHRSAPYEKHQSAYGLGDVIAWINAAKSARFEHRETAK